MFEKRIFHHTRHSNWMDIHNFAKAHGHDWTYMILGRGGSPTGKTYLWNQLQKNGYNAVELSEDICTLVDYRGNENHYLVYEANKCVVIILNKPLSDRIRNKGE